MYQHSPHLDKTKIENAVKEFRKMYDELFQMMNEVLIRNGYPPVEYRKGYFPHFQGQDDGIAARFGKLLGVNFLDDVLFTNQLENVSQFDHVFECVGGAPSGKAIDQMIDTVRPQGTMMLLGVSEHPVPINTRMVLEKGLTMIGRSRSRREDFEDAVRMLEEDDVFAARMHQMVSAKVDVATINDISKAFELAKNAEFKVVINWNT
jgi:threonine dehydrogenase-like Zn-dependent dehydrogenase